MLPATGSVRRLPAEQDRFVLLAPAPAGVSVEDRAAVMLGPAFRDLDRLAVEDRRVTFSEHGISEPASNWPEHPLHDAFHGTKRLPLFIAER